MNKSFGIIIGIVVVVLAGAIVLFNMRPNSSTGNVPQNQPTSINQVACPQDAKQCPDGSYVARVAPSCDFAPCPPINITGWKTVTDAKSKISFQYPADVGTTYIHTQDWPPKVQLTNGPFTCTQAGSENSQAGQTTRQLINGRTYCVTKESEGAAGSIYTQYSYAFASGDKVPVLTFTLRFVQCANYPPAEQAQCNAERTSFDINSIVDRIAQTLTIS